MSAMSWQPCRDCPGLDRRRAAFDALADAGRWVFATVRAWRRWRRERAELARLDARTLADIGLTRAEAEFLINKPFWRKS